ncbi:hypothetical protein MKY34_20540 [Sporosarcina sp. FSL K6-1522]|uniref:hypothetical protein n=1 Tax=Sporosarcina sp. FSL K6-1522 TaxID=2921554 RepID=UPI00315AB8E8
MPVTKLFILGNLTVQSSWVAFMVACVVAYCAVRMRFGKRHAERLSDALFTVLIVWKFSVILTDFSTVIQSPLTLIYFHGGAFGFILGVLFVIGKSIVERKRKPLDTTGLWAMFTGAVTVQVVYQVLMVLLNEGERLAQLVTVILFVVFAVFFWVHTGKVGEWFWQLALLFMAVHMFVAAFQPEGLSGTSFIVTAIIGVFFVVHGRRLEERL